MRFTDALLKDAETLAALESACMAHPWPLCVIAQTLADPLSRIRLLKDGDTLVGYGGLTFAVDTADITTLAVDTAYRRQGLGHLILTELLRLATEKGVTVVFLEVETTNEAAKALYISDGFVPIGVRKHYYGDKDALVMQRVINSDTKNR